MTLQMLMEVLSAIVVGEAVLHGLCSASRRIVVAWIAARRDIAIEGEWSGTFMEVLKELPAGAEVIDSSSGRTRTVRIGLPSSAHEPAASTTDLSADNDGQ